MAEINAHVAISAITLAKSIKYDISQINFKNNYIFSIKDIL